MPLSSCFWLLVALLAAASCSNLVAAQSCGNGVKDGAETDVDCGGGVCVQCLTARACAANSDCLSGSCVNNKCAQPPQCLNGVRDRRETDVDCGGGECFAACALGQACAAPWDCKTRNCTAGVCRQPATCTNGLRDANEAAADCGEVCDAKCSVGASCLANADCASGVCSGGRCVDAPTCVNGVRDGGETDVDCGGGGCSSTCEADQACAAPADCQSGVCSAGACLSTCWDGYQNGLEADIDCGGPSCPPCADTALCWQNSDCASASCAAPS